MYFISVVFFLVIAVLVSLNGCCSCSKFLSKNLKIVVKNFREIFQENANHIFDNYSENT